MDVGAHVLTCENRERETELAKWLALTARGESCITHAISKQGSLHSIH